MKQDEKILAQYYDGELNAKKEAELKRLLDSSPENALTLQNLEKMSELFQVLHEQSHESVSFEGFDKRILNRIHTEKAPVSFTEKLRIWLKEFVSHKKVVWIPAVSVAGAACAVFLAIGMQSSVPTMPSMPQQGAPGTWQASGTTASIVSTIAVTAPEEMNVEKFSFQTESGQRIAVVWIDE